MDTLVERNTFIMGDSLNKKIRISSIVNGRSKYSRRLKRYSRCENENEMGNATYKYL